MPTITTDFLAILQTRIEDQLAIYADGPWQARVYQGDSIVIEVRGRRGFVTQELDRRLVEATLAFDNFSSRVVYDIEHQVQEWLRANPPPRVEAPNWYIPETSSLVMVPRDMPIDQVIDIANGNKIDPAAKTSGIPAPEPERIDKWQHLLGDFFL